jgi:predicted  nucleic acid-binding Zn-ribbon protein
LAVSPTPHRGLYVGITRGRQDNRIHVVTDTTELAEARDVLEAVFAYDRADVPAVTQRRALAQTAGRAQPVPEPRAAIPEWLPGLRAQLDRCRDEIAERLRQTANRRARAAADLADLQPDLAHARAAWRPYAKQINVINRQLDTQLRPAMWQANHDVTRAGVGRLRSAERRAEQANCRVRDAEGAIAAIRADGTAVKQHIDALVARASTLAERADAAVTTALDRLDRDQIHRTGRLGQAIDTWTTWASGGRVATNDLTAAAVLTHAQSNAPVMAIDPGIADRTQWQQLLAPLVDDLHDRGLDIGVTVDHQIESRGISFGLEL